MSEASVTTENTDGQAEVTSSPAPAEAPVEGQAEVKAEESSPDEPVRSLLADESEDGAKPGEEAKPSDAPEQYAEFKLPDTFQKDGPLLEEFVPLAKEAKLPQDTAQKFVDLGAKLIQKAQADQQKAWEGVVSDWTAQIKADKEVGGAALKENTGHAVKALKQYADPETRKYLDESRLANHPGLFKMLVRVGKTLSEDKLFDGGAAQTEQSVAKILYPNMK